MIQDSLPEYTLFHSVDTRTLNKSIQIIYYLKAYNYMLEPDNTPEQTSSNQILVSSSANPYELIKQMNNIISSQKAQIQQYELALNSLTKQRQIILNEKIKIQGRYNRLMEGIRSRNENNETRKSNFSDHLCFRSQFSAKKSQCQTIVSPKYRADIIKAPMSMSIVKADSKQHSVTHKKIDIHEQGQQYIPKPIKLTQKQNEKILPQNSNQDQIKHVYAENLIQDFIVIGPQANQFKNKRSSFKNFIDLEVQASPCPLYNYNKFYKTKKAQFINEIANRVFPEKCSLRHKLIESSEQLFYLIQFQPTNKLSPDYFVFTLKGDQSLLKQRNKTFLNTCNPNNYLYIVCLKLPDIIHIRDEKNYHRKKNEAWITEKVYAVVTYYPFISILVSLLAQIHSILSKAMIRKIIIENQTPLLWGLTKNVFDLQENVEVKQLLHYFCHKKPESNQIYTVNNKYFGFIPENQFRFMYTVALHVCPIFFSSICYEEMLLLLTAVLLEKNLIFISNDESLSTMCALFFTNLIYPFSLDTVLLNCDSSRINQLIFEFPFSMVSSIKKTSKNYEQILYLFAESNVDRATKDDARYIIIDIDSNTILYHHVLQQKLIQSLVSPSPELKNMYLEINSCEPKSFSTTKALYREMVGNREKPRSELQKKEQEKKKYTKQYMQKITNNKTKRPTYLLNQKHENLLKALTEYIQTFTINHQFYHQELAMIKNKNSRIEAVKKHLLEKPIHRDKNKLLHSFLKTQIYANYLDSFVIEPQGMKF